ncbi:hypothetical protein Tco_0573010 [Tanacetum coccineum]
MSTFTENVIVASSKNRPPMHEKGGYDTWQSPNEETGRPAKKSMQSMADLTSDENIKMGCDIKAPNIVLQGLPNDIYTLLNHKTKAYDIWYKRNERRFSKLMNDINMIGLNMTKLLVNTKNVNHLQLEWSRFPDLLALIANTYNSPPSYASHPSQCHPQVPVAPQQPSYPPQKPYEVPAIHQQPPPRPTSLDSRFAILTFLPTDDLIAGLNKDMIWKSNSTDSVKDDTVMAMLVILGGLNTTSIFMTDHVDAFDSDFDYAPTASAIFMARLSLAGSVNGDDAGPSYDIDILSKVPTYNNYHDNDMFQHSIQDLDYFEQPVSINDTYVELTNDNNVISDIPYTDTNENKLFKI